ncbi:hypothetical protein V5F79_01180 [Xanthobacter flavus]
MLKTLATEVIFSKDDKEEEKEPAPTPPSPPEPKYEKKTGL